LYCAGYISVKAELVPIWWSDMCEAPLEC
jgi:hypothetical protein